MKRVFRYLTRRLALTALVISTAMLVVGPGCTEFGSFKFTHESETTTVPGTVAAPLLGPLSSLTFDFNLEQQLQKRDVKAAKGVYLNGLTLEISPKEESENDKDNFNFIEDIYFIANAEGKERKQIARFEDIPDNDLRRLELQTNSGVNLKPYIEQGLTLETDGESAAPEDDTAVKGIITLEVEIL